MVNRYPAAPERERLRLDELMEFDQDFEYYMAPHAAVGNYRRGKRSKRSTS